MPKTLRAIKVLANKENKIKIYLYTDESIQDEHKGKDVLELPDEAIDHYLVLDNKVAAELRDLLDKMLKFSRHTKERI